MKIEQRPIGIGRVILWFIMSIVFLIAFVYATLINNTRAVLVFGAVLVMCISATYIMYKNYKGQKASRKKK